MSEYQVGDQSSKPQDLDQAERVAIAVGVQALQQSMSSFTSFEKMMKNAGQGSDLPGMGGSAGSAAMFGGSGETESSSSPTSLIAGDSMGKKARRKGQLTIADMTCTKCKFTGTQLEKNKILAQRRMVNHAWAGKTGKKVSTSTATSRDLVEECNLLKARMAWLPMRAAYDDTMFQMYGQGHIKAALDTIRAERANPHLTAVISGTANDMQQYQSAFKKLDAGVQENVYASAGSGMKQKLNTLMTN